MLVFVSASEPLTQCCGSPELDFSLNSHRIQPNFGYTQISITYSCFSFPTDLTIAFYVWHLLGPRHLVLTRYYANPQRHKEGSTEK